MLSSGPRATTLFLCLCLPAELYPLQASAVKLKTDVTQFSSSLSLYLLGANSTLMPSHMTFNHIESAVTQTIYANANKT